ncbi:MAG: CocE/NonD family hydrolase [Pseudomonadota bacterium]
MKTLRRFPHRVTRRDDVVIEMPDGTLLAARVWLPDIARTEAVPAVLEYIPYRRRDGTARRDSINHPWFAGHGYASIRVDVRGSGDSGGILEDEYLPEELEDCVTVLRWLGEQTWCNGRVGMIGISWGGFNGLQVAALQPPELQAVITASSTDDRYSDDVHHMGGCLLGDNLSWASIMFAYNSLPPDPASVGDNWRDMWMERLDKCQPWLVNWLEHQRRDEFWHHGSICEDYAAVRAPVFAVSGWADGYSNAVFRLLAGLEVPRRGLIGPWGHLYPHEGQPGPAIGFLQECLRWWDRWLKDADNGIDREPALRVWMQESVPPTTSYRHRPGRWVAEEHWPTDRTRTRSFALHQGVLVDAPAPETGLEQTVQSPLTLGLFAGKWCSYAAGPDLAHDQRQEDGGALTFDSEPLSEPVEILGQPTLTLRLSASRPQAMVAVRLSDVAPDDKATRVTYGLLNLAQRDGPADPQPLEPGHHYTVTVPLNHIAQAFPAGNRLRISVSSSYWPLAWPPPEPVRLCLDLDGCRFDLPVRPERAADAELREFDAPQGAQPITITTVRGEEHNWRVVRDLATDVSTLEVVDDRGVNHLEDIDLTTAIRGLERYSTRDGEFDSARGETRWVWRLERGDWRIRTETRTVLTSDAENFYVQADLDAFENDYRVFCRTFDATIPRDNV